MAKKPIYYFDISKTGKDYTGNKDISLITNEQSVLESVKNIIATEPGERIMNPTFGCPLSKFLFDPLDVMTMVSLKTSITNAIRQFENRVDKLEINIVESDDNELTISVIFNIKMSNTQQTLTLDLTKIR
jgi:phage baseplate assembly protein W